MNKYLITYDLKNTPLSAYAPLHDEIKGISGSWWHYLESTWVIKGTSMSADAISNKLLPHIRQGDRLLVIKIDTVDKQGWLPKDAWNWLNS